MANQQVYIGTSGFSYKDWVGNFYPQFVSQKDWLRYYSSQFNTVEIDATFYGLPRKEVVARWRNNVPDNFIFTAKFPRTVTHEGTDSERIAAAGQFVEVMAELASKRGPMLMQFPYSFKPDRIDFLEKLLDSLPDSGPTTVEIRNRNWLEVDRLFEILAARKIGFCLVDHPWMPRSDQVTADYSYLRMLGDHKKIEEDFSWIRDDKEDALQHWSELIRRFSQDGKTVYIYFNNHFSGHAPTTARRLLELLT